MRVFWCTIRVRLQQVGVHIADVSHFIRPGNALDKEAANRGTTVYLCGKVRKSTSHVCILRWCILNHYINNSTTVEGPFHIREKGSTLLTTILSTRLKICVELASMTAVFILHNFLRGRLHMYYPMCERLSVYRKREREHSNSAVNLKSWILS